MRNIVVLYHSNCPDGFGAAWAAWKKFKNKADYIGVRPARAPSKTIKNKEIYVLDSSLNQGDLKRFLQLKNKITIIDHHKSSKEDVKRAPNYIFDIGHSGSVLAWKYFHPKKKVPRLLKYVEEGDLWKFRSPNIHFSLGYIYAQPYDFKIWDKLHRDMENAEKRKKFIEFGKLISNYNDAVVERVVEKAETVKFGKYKVLAANNSVRNFTSEIGHELYRRKPPLSIIWFAGKDGVKVSLRSNGKVDVAKIAEKFGGGGHKRAAAFSLKRGAKLPWKILKN